MTMLKTYRDLQVWQKAIDFSVKIYALTQEFPKEEIYGLTSQLRRASVSIASNIAEGQKRGSKKDFAQFLRVAYGSCAEVDSQLEISTRIGYIKTAEYEKIQNELIIIMKMTSKLLTSMN